MTRTQLAIGSATFVGVVVAGFPSAIWVDRHYSADAKSNATMPPTSSGACIGEDGTWKNWVWANVPALSPKCAPDR